MTDDPESEITMDQDRATVETPASASSRPRPGEDEPIPRTTPGVIQGKTIVLDAEPGLADGQRVDVTVRPALDPERRRQRLAELAGALADRPDADWEALDALVADRA